MRNADLKNEELLLPHLTLRLPNSSMGRFQSGQMYQTVNLLSYDFGGSNPPLPTLEVGSKQLVVRSFNCKLATANWKLKKAEVAQLVER